MQYLYLDESGDLGFDFVNKKPSKFLTLTILSVIGVDNNRKLINTVKRTIKKKVNIRKPSRITELKASNAPKEVVEYFLRKLNDIEIRVYSLTLNKKRLYSHLSQDKDRVYNYIARLVVDKVELKEGLGCLEFIVDKSKNKKEIGDFDSYIKRQMQGRVDPEKTRLIIKHEDSCVVQGLQAADAISWAIFRKYERKDGYWIRIIKSIICYEDMYLP
ncbi:MAG: DUF3800 domain-containing protein [Candidatus Goldbacteria bacterium]|nr:DUF3800 domain-containing protein [Candidatus Goldiibacteriota bacterium]